MKILISTLGSRGDVQPFLALAVGLQNAGHRVTLAAPQTFADWIQSYGVEVAPVRFNPQQVMQELSKSGGGLRAMRTMREVMNKGMEQAQEDVWHAAQQTDFFIQTGTGMGGLEIAQTRGIPIAFAYLVPVAPTRAFPMFWLPFRFSLGGVYNSLTYMVASRVLWTVGGSITNQWRTRLGLSPWRSEAEMFAHARKLNTPFLYGFSPSFFPKPADWDNTQHVTGYWFLDSPSDWQPPADLLHFLESGPPPVYIGFGSMNSDNPEHQTRIALEALEKAGQRGILLTGWGGISQLPASPNVFFVENVPHSWLFPRVAAVVQHGGAGTTGVGLCAGIPSILTPFGGDQYSWADLVVKAGVGPKASGIKKLTAEKLAESIRTVNDPHMRARAAALGEKIRTENGIARAIEIIEQHATNQRTHS